MIWVSKVKMNTKQTYSGGFYMICDTCANYVYDEDWECYTCMVNMDEDDYYRMMSGGNKECPYYQDNDEYKVVRHQM